VIAIGETRLSLEDGELVIKPLAEVGAIAALHGKSRAMRKLVAEVESLAGTDASVLVIGESGTGKELVARALHDLGPRRDAPFVTVDAAALVPTLFASELFGHERGAFTGADRKHVGAFERARGGTLFLDEIGELSPPVQAGLLGALERRSFRPVGSQNEISVDVRVIAATHRDLRAAVNTNAFRLDLFYRLAVVTLELPPLRSRTGDVPILIEHFVREAGLDVAIEQLFPPDVITQLEGHTWPGNVRELRNLVERTLIVGSPPRQPAPAASAGDPIGSLLEQRYRDARRTLLDEFEQRYLARLLERTGGNVRGAARESGLDRTYLTELLKRHGLK
jgi:DNA-binding NtrC family response regulator